jgi:hypothetical protein
VRDAIQRGQIFGADDDLFAYAGLTPEQGRAYENAAMQHDLAEIKRRAALGDKQSRAVLALVPDSS